MTRPSRVALHGASGRMGTAVEALLEGAVDLTLEARVDRDLPVSTGPPRTAPDFEGLRSDEIDAIIDFTSPEGARTALEAARRLRLALVSGTTGLDPAILEAMRAAASEIPICWAPNFSLGIPLLCAALRQAASLLPRDWAIEIVEIHHARKRDAPSGTALRLARIWEERRGGRRVHGREGMAGPREPGEIGLHAVRIGEVVGEHRVFLGSGGETIEVRHAVAERGAFAAGCVEALRLLLRKGPGWYEWEDLLARS